MALRWGILATGGIARSFTKDLHVAGLDVRAVASRSQESADAFAAELNVPTAHGSYEALFADPQVDIIYIATPHPMHIEPALAALNAGKHVLIEKPITVNEKEAAAIRDTAASKGLLAMEAMWTRYLPHMKRIHEIIDAGTLGEIRLISADHTQSALTYHAHHMHALELGDSDLLVLGICPISFVHDILGTLITTQASARSIDTDAHIELAHVMTH